jgi:hypothetical protein
MPPWRWCQCLPPGAGAVAAAVALVPDVVAAAATAAPAATLAVAASNKPNVLFNFMTAFLNSCRAIVTYR